MPHIIFKNLSESTVKEFSKNNELSTIINCPDDWLTYEYVPSTYYYQGEKINSFAFIEIKWYERPQEVKEKTAQYIIEKLKSLCDIKQITIVFTILSEDNYFER